MKRYVIGIAGGSASGKTSIVNTLKNVFQHDIAVLYFDDYYKDLSHLPFEKRVEVNFDHPDAFDLDLLAKHLSDLKQGKNIVKPIYDFKQHNRLEKTEILTSRPIILVDGLFTLAVDEIANQCDLRLYVDTPADIRFIRRLERDMLERGRSIESVKHQYLTTVRPMHEQYVEPSKSKADLIVPNSTGYNVAMDVIISKIRSKLQ